ncbi:hypothetical protein DFP72DRAFT_1085622 [Ephemerocybe angulata]|uniref:Uncharacterized protein n=1 Tax=Ephemerocybe angulata TaxID=980116 RepID=A0A8H6H5P7_9AGAR|nr:hypothetical protein DFP72DRAFT_1085622 [Tulosesus angulatus]
MTAAEILKSYWNEQNLYRLLLGCIPSFFPPTTTAAQQESYKGQTETGRLVYFAERFGRIEGMHRASSSLVALKRMFNPTAVVRIGERELGSRDS